MCGRYTLTRQALLIEDFEASLGLAARSEWWKPRYNVAPTQPAPVVTVREGTRQIEMMRWGLIPSWGGRPGARPPLAINARKESLKDTPMFRDGLTQRRCLVPADGFFEWKREGKGAPSQAMFIHPRDSHTFAFAGLWSRALTDQGEVLSFAIVTGPPNPLVAPIHDRMPVVLRRRDHDAWLDPEADVDHALGLLAIPSDDGWLTEPVSAHVNSARHDDPRCIEPIELLPPVQGSLF
jgi:putative SOS response-associated peptidase YedK